MICLIILKNIIRNKKSSLIILLLVASITFVFFTGNSLIGRTDRELRNAYTENFTGDVLIQKTDQVSMGLFGANTPIIDSYFTIPVIPAYNAVMDIATAEPGVVGIAGQVVCSAYMEILDIQEPVLVFGIDAAAYFSLFPGIVLEEGRLLEEGEYGVMITADRAERLEKRTGNRLEIGMPILMTSGGETGFKIRELPLTGIYRYRNPGQSMNEVVLMDPQTVRVLSSIQVATSDAEAGEDALALLDLDPGDLFGDDLFAGSLESSDEGVFSVDYLENYLKEDIVTDTVAAVGGDWNFIILRLEKGISPMHFITSFNKKLTPYGVTAVGWRTAAGMSAMTLLLLSALFNSGVILVGIAGVMVVINLLLISVFRRTREIGALRAIGASDGYIRFLILGENCILACLGGLAGVLGGLFVFSLINKAGIVIPNSLIASLMGGRALIVEFVPSVAAVSLAVAVILGMAASLYPVETAVRIEPIAAIRQG
ncbi:FtsX-like permease family protein [Treponema primitia]|uniref:ABC transporter permease n=1 Tax=Treponema primitia TaxID=88058 RepID=UPI00398161A0